MIVKVKAGFTKDGKLLALHSDVTDDTGSYAFSGSLRWHLRQDLRYRCINAQFENNRKICIYKHSSIQQCGAGNPQAHWAVENMMEEAAEDLGIDPIELQDA